MILNNPHSARVGIICLEGAVAHAARGCDGRQEGRERGYYNLHRNLNDSLLHTLPLLSYLCRWGCSHHRLR